MPIREKHTGTLEQRYKVNAEELVLRTGNNVCLGPLACQLEIPVTRTANDTDEVIERLSENSSAVGKAVIRPMEN